MISVAAFRPATACSCQARCQLSAGSSNFYGIGGNGQVRLYLGTIQISGHPHTFFIALDAGDHADLTRLAQAAKPVIGSVRLPTGTASG